MTLERLEDGAVEDADDPDVAPSADAEAVLVAQTNELKNTAEAVLTSTATAESEVAKKGRFDDFKQKVKNFVGVNQFKDVRGNLKKDLNGLAEDMDEKGALAAPSADKYKDKDELTAATLVWLMMILAKLLAALFGAGVQATIVSGKKIGHGTAWTGLKIADGLTGMMDKMAKTPEQKELLAKLKADTAEYKKMSKDMADLQKQKKALPPDATDVQLKDIDDRITELDAAMKAKQQQMLARQAEITALKGKPDLALEAKQEKAPDTTPVLSASAAADQEQNELKDNLAKAAEIFKANGKGDSTDVMQVVSSALESVMYMGGGGLNPTGKMAAGALAAHAQISDEKSLSNGNGPQEIPAAPAAMPSPETMQQLKAAENGENLDEKAAAQAQATAEMAGKIAGEAHCPGSGEIVGKIAGQIARKLVESKTDAVLKAAETMALSMADPQKSEENKTEIPQPQAIGEAVLQQASQVNDASLGTAMSTDPGSGPLPKPGLDGAKPAVDPMYQTIQGAALSAKQMAKPIVTAETTTQEGPKTTAVGVK